MTLRMVEYVRKRRWMNIIKKNLEFNHEIIYTKDYLDELANISYYISIGLREKNIAEKLLTKIRRQVLNIRQNYLNSIFKNPYDY